MRNGEYQRHSVINWAQENAENLERDDHFEEPSADGPGEFICEKCGRRCTRSSQSGVEYGHSRGARQREMSCPNRPEGVDPHGGFSGVPGGSA